MTPTRDELVSRFYATNHGTWEEAADVVLPLLAERDAALQNGAIKYLQMVAERDAALALVKRKNREIDDQRKVSERRLQLMARNWRERNAALVEVERLRGALFEMSDIRLERESERNEARRIAEDQRRAVVFHDDRHQNEAMTSWRTRSWQDTP